MHLRSGRLTRKEVTAEVATKIPFVTSKVAQTAAHAGDIAEALGFPVVLKGLAPHLAHKTELGLVRLGLLDRRAVEEAYEQLADVLRSHANNLGEGWVEVQPMVTDGHELLVAARRDPEFGPIVIVGAGGKLVELVSDSALRLGPISTEEAGEMVAETRLYRLLTGFRGGAVYDLDAAKAADIGALASHGRGGARGDLNRDQSADSTSDGAGCRCRRPARGMKEFCRVRNG